MVCRFLISGWESTEVCVYIAGADEADIDVNVWWHWLYGQCSGCVRVCVCGHNGDCFECCVRCKVYKILASVGIDKPRYTAVNRDSPTEGSVCFPDFLVCW